MEKKKKPWIIFVVIGAVLLILFVCCGIGGITAIIASVTGSNKGNNTAVTSNSTVPGDTGVPIVEEKESNEWSAGTSEQEEEFFIAETGDEEYIRTAWYNRPTELGNDSTIRRFELNSYVYELPCPLTEFLNTGYEIREAFGWYDDIYGEPQLPRTPDDIMRFDSTGYVYLEKDDLLLECYIQNEDSYNDIPLKYSKVTRVKVNQFLANNPDPVHIYTPAKRGKIDLFYMTPEERLRENAGIEVYVEKRDETDLLVVFADPTEYDRHTFYTFDGEKVRSVVATATSHK